MYRKKPRKLRAVQRITLIKKNQGMAKLKWWHDAKEKKRKEIAHESVIAWFIYSFI